MEINKETAIKPIRTGFAVRPDVINRTGRPPEGQSLTGMVAEILESSSEVRAADGTIIKVKLKKILAKKMVDEALKGNVKMATLIWNHHDGMPVQKIIQSYEEAPTPEDEKEFNSFLENGLQQEKNSDHPDS